MIIEVNGEDLNRLDTTPTGRYFRLNDRNLPFVGRKTEVLEIPGRVGGLRVGDQIPAGQLSVSGWFRGTNHTEAIRIRRELARILSAEEHVIRFADYPDCEWVGHLQQSGTSAKFLNPQWGSRRGNISLNWMLPDPTSRARAETVLESAGGIDLPLGDAPGPLRAEVVNGSGAPIKQLSLQMYVSGVLQVLVFWTGDLPVGGTWAADGDLGTITVNGVNARNGVAVGQGWTLPYIRPALGPHTLAAEVGGGGARTLRARYRKHWWG